MLLFYRSRFDRLVSRRFGLNVRLIILSFWLSNLYINWLILLSFFLWICHNSFDRWYINVWLTLLLFYIYGFGSGNNWRFYLNSFLHLISLIFVNRVFPWFLWTETHSFLLFFIQSSAFSHGPATIFTNWFKIQWFVILVWIFAPFVRWIIIYRKIVSNQLLISNQILWYYVSSYLINLSDVSWIIKIILSCPIVISLNEPFGRILVDLSFRVRLNYCIVLDSLIASLLWVQRWLISRSLKALLISRRFTDPLWY